MEDPRALAAKKRRRRLVVVLLVLALVPIVLFGGVSLFLESAAGKALLREKVLALVDDALAGKLEAGQLELRFVPFKELVDPKTLRTEVRFVELGSDFHRLARNVETRLPGRKPVT